MRQSPAEIQKRYYEKRKAAGLVSLSKKRKDRLRLEGRCINCGKESDGTTRCRGCLEKGYEHVRAKRRSRKCNIDGCQNVCWTRSNYCQEHLEEWRKTRKSTHALRLEKGLCAACGERPIDGKRTWECRECAEVRNKREKERRSQERVIVLNLYGGECVCCGESEFAFLALDHINNDGFKEKESGRRARIYRSIYRAYLAGKPLRDDIQILCHNCNCAKGYYGICPHERARMEKRECLLMMVSA